MVAPLEGIMQSPRRSELKISLTPHMALRLVLRLIIDIIYAAFIVIVLYFPFAQILVYVARETRFFRFQQTLQVEDSLPICLGLAVVYAVVSALRRVVEPEADISGEISKDGSSD